MMLALLSPRLWIALALAGLFAFTHIKAFQSGKADVQVKWDKERAEITAEALKASEAARAKEQVLTTANSKITNDYMVQKKLRAADAISAAGKLRDLQASLGNPGGADAAAESGDYGDPRSEIIAGCASTVIVLDEATKRLTGQTTALQRYIGEVCMIR